MRPPRRGRAALLTALAALALPLCVAPSGAHAQPAGQTTTAWHDGRFVTDPAGIVGRSDIVLEHPNTMPTQAMPLGNGQLGVGLWAADGLTAQLNRIDTMPDRKSPGQLVIPGLARLTQAPDYRGRLDLYDGTFTESGGGMTATVRVSADADQLVVDVTGADPGTVQTASVGLWAPRTPVAAAHGSIGTLAETWQDTGRPASTGQTYGCLAALTAGGRSVVASVTDARTVGVSFRPRADGSFRVVVAAPHWAGGDAQGTAARLLPGVATAVGRPDSAHLAWWHGFWGRAGLFDLDSADGTAQYLENLRTIDLYVAAAQRGTAMPGSQAGVADLFATTRDYKRWDPSAYWHWNLRMQVAANLSSGVPDLNAAYFNLYTNDLGAIEDWTRQNMAGRPGACVPETMRFNGAGIQYKGPDTTPAYDCDANSIPFYNARTLSTGAEVSLWAWQQYQLTGDRAFLAREYPLMAASAQFLLSYAKPGTDGLLHTSPSNAHETQWDVTDPTTDIAAMSALFPATAQAAGILHRDPDLAARLRAAIPHIPPLPRTDAATQKTLLPASADAGAADVIAPSYEPAAPKENSENVGLEPVWPYGLIGDQSPLFALAQRTFADRPTKLGNDWSFDPIQAARLDDATDLKSTLIALTEQYQKYPSGLAAFVGPEFYSEQIGVVAAAMNEGLVQDYDGLLRIAPAWPSDWNGSGTVAIAGGGRVDVQITGGTPTTVVLEAGSTMTQRIRNPFPGQRVEVVESTGGGHDRVVVAPTGAAEVSLTVHKGASYLIERPDAPSTSLPYAPVTGERSTVVRQLDGRTIGVNVDCRPQTGTGPLVDWVPDSGSTVADRSGNGRDASVVGTPGYTSDPRGGPALVLGTGAYLRTAQPVNVGGFTSATFAARVRVDGSGTQRVLLADAAGAFQVLLTGSNQVRFVSPWASESAATTLPTGQFVTVAVTLDVDGNFTVYVNGARQWTGPLGPQALGSCTSADLLVGADANGGERLTGAVGEVAVWPRALTPDELAAWPAG